MSKGKQISTNYSTLSGHTTRYTFLILGKTGLYHTVAVHSRCETPVLQNPKGALLE